MVDAYIKLLEEHINTIQVELYKLKDDIDFARKNYIEVGALPEQYIPCFNWKTRDVTPSKGLIWASDGYCVWLIHSQGVPISESATKVLFWTESFIPTPPLTPPRNETK